MVDGRWLMRGKAPLAFDEAAALTEVETVVAGLQERTAARLATLGRNAPGVRLGRYRATDSSYLAITSGTFLVMLSAHHRAMC